MIDYWREVKARERGASRIIPPADCQVALVYPNSYAVGMSSLGYQMVYRWINQQPGALAERFFCEGSPSLSVENQRPPGQFDWVAFSISYELDYLAVIRFLLENGVAVRAAERNPRMEPLVILGGICLVVNRMPLYDLADVLVVGDGEGVVEQLVTKWTESGGDRVRFLQAISCVDGVEVTEGAQQRFQIADCGTVNFGVRIANCGMKGKACMAPADVNGAECATANTRQIDSHSEIRNPKSAIANRHSTIVNLKSAIQNPQSFPPHFMPSLTTPDAYSMIVAPFTELGDRCLVEIARGCPYRCRFCFVGHCVPYRVRPFEAVREMMERGRHLTPHFGLIAPAVGSHPDIERICEWTLREGLKVSFSSLRLEDVKPAMVEVLAAAGQRSVTVAPEAGSERLRRQLGKNLTDEGVITFAADVVARGLTDLRLYFMVGLPGEEDEDIEAIGRLVAATRRAALAARPTPDTRILVSGNASVFTPKPGTPFGEAETPSPAQIKKRLRRLGTLLGRIGGVLFRLPSPAEAEMQRILTWGGRDLLPALIEAAKADEGWRETSARVLHRRKDVDHGDNS